MSEETVHRLRSVLTRLRLEIELSDSLAPEERGRVLEAVDEAFALLLPRGNRDRRRNPTDVILIEDEDELGRLMATQLTRAGVNAAAVASVAAAMLTASSDTTIVLDLSAIEGVSSTEEAWLRGRRPIVVTGASVPIATAVAERLNARKVVPKPIRVNDLVVALGRRVEEEER